MRLTCPRCAAQYQIADAAIPAAGREVECSACGHVWHQDGPGKSVPEPAAAAPAPDFDPLARPVLNRRLDESVLSILREEAARELRVRNGGAPTAAADHIPATEPAPEAPAEAQSEPAPEAAAPTPQIDWPATTLTVAETVPAPTERRAAISPVEPAAETPAEAPVAETTPESPAEPDPASVMATPEPDRDVPALPDAAELAATLTRPVLPEPSPAPSPDLEAARTSLRPAQPDAPQAAVTALLPEIVPPRRRSGYASGFGLAAMLALGIVALYALAPQIPADKGGAVLAEWRQGIDRGRLWLHDRVIGD